MHIIPIGVDSFDEVRSLEREVAEALPDKTLLRRNSPEMLRACLSSPHIALGAYDDGKLVGLSVLWIPDEDEALAPLLRTVDISAERHANYKLCIVAPQARGKGLQRRMARVLIDSAAERGFTLLCATVAPHNMYSICNLSALGFERDCQIHKYGAQRLLFYRRLP